MNNIELKATRLGFGLTSKEAASIFDVAPRTMNYWESARFEIPSDVQHHFFVMSSHYTLLLEILKKDIDLFNKNNPLPDNDDSDEYFEKMKSVKKLSLPFFVSFDAFKSKTSNQSEAYWRIWQSVISHLFIIGKLRSLKDSTEIPNYFTCNSWLSGDFD